MRNLTGLIENHLQRVKNSVSFFSFPDNYFCTLHLKNIILIILKEPLVRDCEEKHLFFIFRRKVHDRFGGATSFTGTYRADEWSLKLPSPQGQSGTPCQTIVCLSEVGRLCKLH